MKKEDEKKKKKKKYLRDPTDRGDLFYKFLREVFNVFVGSEIRIRF